MIGRLESDATRLVVAFVFWGGLNFSNLVSCKSEVMVVRRHTPHHAIALSHTGLSLRETSRSSCLRVYRALTYIKTNLLSFLMGLIISTFI